MSPPQDPSSLRGRLSHFFGCGSNHFFGCAWNCLLELMWLLWIARVPSGVVVLGYLLLGFAPQAQDLLIPLVDSSPFYLLLFFVLRFLSGRCRCTVRRVSSSAMTAGSSTMPRPILPLICAAWNTTSPGSWASRHSRRWS